MDDIHTAKSVLKKLSALRATLLDEEQLYLDLLVVERHRTTTIDAGLDTAKAVVSGATGNRDKDSSEIAKIIDSADAGKITWNSMLEVYELEKT